MAYREIKKASRGRSVAQVGIACVSKDRSYVSMHMDDAESVGINGHVRVMVDKENKKIAFTPGTKTDFVVGVNGKGEKSVMKRVNARKALHTLLGVPDKNGKLQYFRLNRNRREMMCEVDLASPIDVI